MSDPSPALKNKPHYKNKPPNSPRAGFRSPQPQGVTPSTKPPSLSGWPRAIAWNEFDERNSRPSGEMEAAQISVELNPNQVSVAQENGQFKLGAAVFQMVVKKSDSWVVKTEKDATLLAHEQGHFDLAGLCYRDMVQELAKLRTSSVKELEKEIKRIMEQYDQKSDTLSKQYDSSQETDHGRNTTRQKIWEKQIQTCINSGMPFTVPP
ncbi:conserved hypothetical protein [Crenothrix polyspora]|uniref:DUF922 domain-containing protein n=2 Tax=Crenothrix polyspora TaxID=360316 RepID=A0A1R4GZV2_9GAMM|nr:conserved hypothetical protein [Crenothrix polyspora]